LKTPPLVVVVKLICSHLFLTSLSAVGSLAKTADMSLICRYN
jgi:hypothetical protein